MMFNCEQVSLQQVDPLTALPYSWQVVLPDGKKLPWQGFYTGPLSLHPHEIEGLCQTLLGIDGAAVAAVAAQELQPVTTLGQDWSGLIMHSMTPDNNALEGDLDKLIRRVPPSDYTAYAEARSVYLAWPGDLAIGRISPWKTAVTMKGIEAVKVPGIDYYYLSHALLRLAERHLSSPTTPLQRMIEFLRRNGQTVVRLYALEREMQIFLIWLKRQAGLDRLYIDANSPEVSRCWNRKSVLHPEVDTALTLAIPSDRSPYACLAAESRGSLLHRELGLNLPVLPGYTIVRSGVDRPTFVQQTLQAAQLLLQRYQLQRGCLKASESGDGARIFPGLDLTATSELEALARDAYSNGDDYVLEAHVNYLQVNVGFQVLQTTPSAHIRWGQVAEGLTLQLTEGTSWKGNIYIDAETADQFGVSQVHYQQIMQAMQAFHHGFRSRHLGLAIAGIDFAIGRIGGLFADDVLLAVQDPNISFNGAECLRVFADKLKVQPGSAQQTPLYAATKVIRPSLQCPLPVLRQITDRVTQTDCITDVIASVPGRWGMIAAAGQHPQDAIAQLSSLVHGLGQQGLVI